MSNISLRRRYSGAFKSWFAANGNIASPGIYSSNFTLIHTMPSDRYPVGSSKSGKYLIYTSVSNGVTSYYVYKRDTQITLVQTLVITDLPYSTVTAYGAAFTGVPQFSKDDTIMIVPIAFAYAYQETVNQNNLVSGCAVYVFNGSTFVYTRCGNFGVNSYATYLWSDIQARVQSRISLSDDCSRLIYCVTLNSVEYGGAIKRGVYIGSCSKNPNPTTDITWFMNQWNFSASQELLYKMTEYVAVSPDGAYAVMGETYLDDGGLNNRSLVSIVLLGPYLQSSTIMTTLYGSFCGSTYFLEMYSNNFGYAVTAGDINNINPNYIHYNAPMRFVSFSWSGTTCSKSTIPLTIGQEVVYDAEYQGTAGNIYIVDCSVDIPSCLAYITFYRCGDTANSYVAKLKLIMTNNVVTALTLGGTIALSNSANHSLICSK